MMNDRKNNFEYEDYDDYVKDYDDNESYRASRRKDTSHYDVQLVVFCWAGKTFNPEEIIMNMRILMIMLRITMTTKISVIHNEKVWYTKCSFTLSRKDF